MIHSFCRLILAWLGLYKADVFGRYYYANNGPFEPVDIRVLDQKEGFVQYGVERDGIRTVHWTSDSTFALMCRKHAPSHTTNKEK